MTNLPNRAFKLFLFGLAVVGGWCVGTALFYFDEKIFPTHYEAGHGLTLASRCPPDREPKSLEAALLPPPEFSRDLPDELEATKEGGVILMWNPVDKALRYEIAITDLKGSHVNSIKTPFTNIKLKDFRSGKKGLSEFYVKIATVNIDGKAGSFNQARKITVRDRPDIMAPTIKSIKTVD